MTMITLTTIGFGEIYPLSPEGRIFTVVIIFLGFGIVGYSALTGRQLNPKLEITARAGERSAQTKLKLVGADRVINPYVLGGMRLVVGVLKPDVLELLDAVVDYKEQQIELEQIRIAANSLNCGKKLGDTGISQDPRFIVLSIRKRAGDSIFNPPPETVLEPDDTLIAIGDITALGRLG